MNKLKMIVMLPLLAALAMMAGCQEEEVIPTHSKPGWTAIDNPDHDVTMTVIMTLPDHLAGNTSDGDEIAAFIGDQCRGTANRVDNLYYVMVDGTENEAGDVYFRYYCANTGYMYRSATAVPFKANANEGTPDEPLSLTFDIIKN